MTDTWIQEPIKAPGKVKPLPTPFLTKFIVQEGECDHILYVRTSSIEGVTVGQGEGVDLQVILTALGGKAYLKDCEENHKTLQSLCNRTVVWEGEE